MCLTPVFGLALIYLLLGIGYLLDRVAVVKASGYVGIVTAFIAYYTVAETLYKANGVPIALYVSDRVEVEVWRQAQADARIPSWARSESSRVHTCGILTVENLPRVQQALYVAES